MPRLKGKSAQNKIKPLDLNMEIFTSQEDYRRDPASLRSFLTNEEYDAVAQMLDLPPLDQARVKLPIQVPKEANPTTPDYISDERWEMSVNLGSVTKPERPARYRSGNPYLKFLRNPEKHATKWRKPEPMKAKDILNASTVEKSKFITDKIIGDFIKWRKSICDNKDVEIDETVLCQLFDIGIKKPENVKLFRRKVIPRDIFEPKMMKQGKTWKQVKKHIGKSLVIKKSDKPKESPVPSGSKQTSPDQTKRMNSRSKSREVEEVVPEVSQSTRLWSKCEANIGDIVSSVWKNKLNYKCVQAFCKYLDQNPQIRKPEYLIQMNMFSQHSS